MALAGVAWGVYSLRGRGASDPLAETAGNFARAVPLAVGVSVAAAPAHRSPRRGALLAVAVGRVGVRTRLRRLVRRLPGSSATRAASVQLAVPVLAAAGGVLFLSERITGPADRRGDPDPRRRGARAD